MPGSAGELLGAEPMPSSDPAVQQAAQSAGLIYAHDHEPGIKRTYTSWRRPLSGLATTVMPRKTRAMGSPPSATSMSAWRVQSSGFISKARAAEPGDYN